MLDHMKLMALPVEIYFKTTGGGIMKRRASSKYSKLKPFKSYQLYNSPFMIHLIMQNFRLVAFYLNSYLTFNFTL